MHHDIKAQPIMLSHYLQEENKDVVSDKRLADIANGFPLQVYRDWETDRKSTRLNSSHSAKSRMPSSA